MNSSEGGIVRFSLRIPFALLIAVFFLIGSTAVYAQVPSEVTGVTLDGGDTLAWGSDRRR